jgi:hypothetical protein
MLVKWNGDGMLSVQPIDPANPSVIKASMVQAQLLYPGWNEVPDNLWDFCKIHIQSFIEAGKIEEISEKVKSDKGIESYVGVPIEGICSRTPKRALAVIDECYNLPLLEKWKSMGITDKETINIALNKQIEACYKGEDRNTNTE